MADDTLTPAQPAPRHAPRWLIMAALLAILLGTFLLRAWQLDRHGLWWDEGNNAYFAHAGLAELLEMSRLTNDTNPPAHRLALGLWLGLLGDSVFNARLLSVVCGLGTVCLAYYWGRRMHGAGTGLLAAALVGLAPMIVFYTREAKGYPFVLFFGWLALTLFARAMLPAEGRLGRAQTWALWAGYLIASALALGTHYYAAFLQVAQGAWLLGALALGWPGWPAARRRLAPWIGAQVGTLLLVLPWVLLTWRTAFAGAQNVPMTRGAWDALPYLRQLWLTVAAGPYGQRPWSWLALGALALPAAWELFRGHDARRGLLAVVLLLPGALGYAAQGITPFVIPRFFLYTVPALCLLAAAGLMRLRWLALPLGLALLVAWASVMPQVYRPLAPPEEDLRPLGETIAALAQPGDGVIVSYIWQEGMLRLYAPRTDVDYHLGWFTDAEVADQMQVLWASHPRLWLVTYQVPLQHPSNQGGWWLEQHAARVLEQEHGHSRAALYLPPCADHATPNEARFAGEIHLRHSTPPAEARPGEALPLALEWTLGEPVSQPLAAFVQLLDPGGRLVSQSDGAPRNGLVPFGELAAGEPISDCRGLLVPPEAPPGPYTVIAGLYNRENGERLVVMGPDEASANYVTLGTVDITPE